VKDEAKKLINRFMGVVGLRIVNVSWGPRGFAAPLRQALTKGILVDTVIDIGASDGCWTLECLKVLPQANYFLVEPLDEHRPRLMKLAAANPAVSIWNGLLGKKADVVGLHVHGDQSSILDSSEYAGSEIRKIEARPLDAFLASGHLRGRLLIKLDVQGAELTVLEGAAHCLRQTELVLLEVSFQQIYHSAPLVDAVISWMANAGFRVFDICSYVQRPYDGLLAQADLFFARPDSLLFAHQGWE
jgi:FkbM family methyltransferase